MKKKQVEVCICRDEEESWDTIWKWSWFTREIWMPHYWEKTKIALQPVLSLLPCIGVKSILDCSCGLGFKTVLFAKTGYEVEGSDASVVAVKHARQLAKEQGLKVRFFRSRFEELDKNCKRKYDCVYSDYFDELETYKTLKESAKGIYSVLKRGGKFIFCSPSPEWTKPKLKELIEQEWEKRERFKIQPPLGENGLKVMHIEVADKTPEGILENHLYLIEDRDRVRVKIAPLMNPRIKWTFQDYVKLLKKVGFRKIEYIKREKEEIIVITTK